MSFLQGGWVYYVRELYSAVCAISQHAANFLYKGLTVLEKWEKMQCFVPFRCDVSAQLQRVCMVYMRE